MPATGARSPLDPPLAAALAGASQSPAGPSRKVPRTASGAPRRRDVKTALPGDGDGDGVEEPDVWANCFLNCDEAAFLEEIASCKTGNQQQKRSVAARYRKAFFKLTPAAFRKKGFTNGPTAQHLKLAERFGAEVAGYTLSRRARFFFPLFVEFMLTHQPELLASIVHGMGFKYRELIGRNDCRTPGLEALVQGLQNNSRLHTLLVLLFSKPLPSAKGSDPAPQDDPGPQDDPAPQDDPSPQDDPAPWGPLASAEPEPTVPDDPGSDSDLDVTVLDAPPEPRSAPKRRRVDVPIDVPIDVSIDRADDGAIDGKGEAPRVYDNDPAVVALVDAYLAGSERFLAEIQSYVALRSVGTPEIERMIDRYRRAFASLDNERFFAAGIMVGPESVHLKLALLFGAWLSQLTIPNAARFFTADLTASMLKRCPQVLSVLAAGMFESYEALLKLSATPGGACHAPAINTLREKVRTTPMMTVEVTLAVLDQAFNKHAAPIGIPLRSGRRPGTASTAATRAASRAAAAAANEAAAAAAAADAAAISVESAAASVASPWNPIELASPRPLTPREPVPELLTPVPLASVPVESMAASEAAPSEPAESTSLGRDSQPSNAVSAVSAVPVESAAAGEAAPSAPADPALPPVAVPPELAVLTSYLDALVADRKKLELGINSIDDQIALIRHGLQGLAAKGSAGPG